MCVRVFYIDVHVVAVVSMSKHTGYSFSRTRLLYRFMGSATSMLPMCPTCPWEVRPGLLKVGLHTCCLQEHQQVRARTLQRIIISLNQTPHLKPQALTGQSPRNPKKPTTSQNTRTLGPGTVRNPKPGTLQQRLRALSTLRTQNSKEHEQLFWVQ